MSQIKYKLNPSIMSAFQRYLDADIEFEGQFNVDADGNYKRTYDEIAAELEQDLIDKINHIPQEPSEAADKGTVFNECIDRLILHTKDGREDVNIHSGEVMVDGEMTKAIFGSMEGFNFIYDLQLCLGVSQMLKGAIPQHYCEAVLPTKYGDVLLYGYIDYILENLVIDLKTTKMYNFPKFNRGFQHFVYPYCLIESGEMDEVSEFDYLVVKWTERVNRPISGDLYKEPYSYNHEYAKKQLKGVCEQFIEWLELNRDRIVHRKIFAEDDAV